MTAQIPPEALRLAEGAADGCLDDLARMLNAAGAGQGFTAGDLLEFLRSVAVSVMEAAAPKIREAEREQQAAMLCGCADNVEVTVTPDPKYTAVYVAGMRRAAGLVLHGDMPAVATEPGTADAASWTAVPADNGWDCP